MNRAPKVSVLVPFSPDGELTAASFTALAQQQPLACGGAVQVVAAAVSGVPLPEPAVAWPPGWTVATVEPASSQAAAVGNQLIAAAAGDLVAWCQPGDTFAASKLAEQASLLDEDSTLDAAFSFAVFRDLEGAEDHALAEPFNVDLGEEELAHRLLCGNVLVGSTAMVRRQALEAVGPLDEQFIFAQDFDLWMRLLVHGGVRIVPLPLTTCRVDGRQVSDGIARRVAQESWQVITRHASQLMRRWPPLPQTNYAFISHVAELATASEDWQVVIDYLGIKRQCFGHDDEDCLRIADCLLRQGRAAEARTFLAVLSQEVGRLAPATMARVEEALAALPADHAGRPAEASPPAS